MKRILAVICCILTLACKKDTDTPATSSPEDNDKVKSFLGTYHVAEDVYYLRSGNFVAHSNFTGYIIRTRIWWNSFNDILWDSLNVIGLVQAARPNSVPWNWHGPNSITDTAKFKLMPHLTKPGVDTLIAGSRLGGQYATTRIQIINEDSLRFTYFHSASINDVYNVKQLWVRE